MKRVPFLLFLFVFFCRSAALADPYADMAKAQKAFYAVHSFRATIAGTKMPGKSILMEFVAPDRYHVKLPVGDEYIIGDTMTMNMNGMHVNIPMQGQMKSMMQNLRGWASNRDMKKDFTITDAGTQDGLHAYKYVDHQHPDNAVMMYVGSDNLPRKSVVTDKTGGTTTITYSDYNTPITINP